MATLSPRRTQTMVVAWNTLGFWPGSMAASGIRCSHQWGRGPPGPSQHAARLRGAGFSLGDLPPQLCALVDDVHPAGLHSPAVLQLQASAVARTFHMSHFK